MHPSYEGRRLIIELRSDLDESRGEPRRHASTMRPPLRPNFHRSSDFHPIINIAIRSQSSLRVYRLNQI
jgi:hypothetical protein